jgi:hypothetical protein
MLTLLVILLIVFLVFGGWGSSRYGPASWSPLGIVLVILLILLLLGYIRV